MKLSEWIEGGRQTPESLLEALGLGLQLRESGADLRDHVIDPLCGYYRDCTHCPLVALPCATETNEQVLKEAYSEEVNKQTD